MGIGRLSPANNQNLEQTQGSNGNIAYQPPTQAPETNQVNPASPLFSVTAKESEYSDPRNAPIVSRVPRRNGIVNAYVRGGEAEHVLPLPSPPVSSLVQQTLVRLWQWSINNKWYIAYPAATVMNGGKHNLGLAEKTPQLNTRTTGGPGNIQMGPRPIFRRVQNVPRYSTAPTVYDTQGRNT